MQIRELEESVLLSLPGSLLVVLIVMLYIPAILIIYLDFFNNDSIRASFYQWGFKYAEYSAP